MKRKTKRRKDPTPKKRSDLQPIHINIRSIRKERGISQQALADAAGICVTAVSHWERGLSAPRAGRVPLVAEALSVSVDELYA